MRRQQVQQIQRTACAKHCQVSVAAPTVAALSLLADTLQHPMSATPLHTADSMEYEWHDWVSACDCYSR